MLAPLKIFKHKSKEGVVERANNECEVICKGMFKKETNLALFSGLRVSLSTGEEGTIGEPFGQSGKFKVRCTSEWNAIVSILFSSSTDLSNNSRSFE